MALKNHFIIYCVTKSCDWVMDINATEENVSIIKK
jgi:hypothetical protein